MCNMDIFIRNMLSFLKESSRLQILHIDGVEFYANNEGLKSFKGKSIASSQLRQLIKVLKNAIIDGAEKIENVCSTDIVSRNMPSFLKESNRL